MAPQLKQKIEANQDSEAVATMYDDLFRLAADRQSQTWQSLNNLRADRAKLLTERAEQARRAAAEREERDALARGEIVLASLKLNHLQNADLFRAIYTGEAEAAGLSRSNLLFTKSFRNIPHLFRSGVF